MEVRTAYNFHLLYKHTYTIAVSTALTVLISRSTFISVNTHYLSLFFILRDLSGAREAT